MTVHVAHLEANPDITTITLDRPDRRNALDLEMLATLHDAVRDAAARQARAVVLAGADGYFCSGADLGSVDDDKFVRALRKVLESMHAAPIPFIAAIEGAALGAGTQLALGCDLRMSTPDAKLGIPAARLGLTIDQWTLVQLTRQVGASIARAMLTGAEVYSGQRLFETGFIHRLTDGENDVVAMARDWAQDIAKLAPLTIAAHKAMLEEVDHVTEPSDQVAQTRLKAWRSKDFAEGKAAFAERRTARFTGS